MVAFELPEEDEIYLGLIDQPDTERPFVSALLQWRQSPFKEILLLSQQAKGKGKRQQRLSSFKIITQFIDQIKPDIIYTGNDRRIEFQFAMHQARKSNKHSIGTYLDDGTYSYLGRATHWLKDKVIDNLVKKLSYGLWWRQPSTIGASNWIDRAILAFPESAIDALKVKFCTSLPKNLDRDEFKTLAELCLNVFNYPAKQIENINSLIMLPHESVATDKIKKHLGYWLLSQGDRISFKHHPRTDGCNAVSDKEAWFIPGKAEQVPAGIPMEVLLPLIQSNCHIAGDVSTALLTTKWLRPELNVTVFVTADTSTQWIQLLNLLDIQIETI